MNYLQSIVDMAIEAAPWLLIGLLAAAAVRAWVPTGWIAGQLGHRGVGPVLKAAVVGIPLPLCSCGVLPTALGLRRQGASRPATAAFLVSTPEIGLDSFMLSYALLGPLMAVVRPIAAFISAVGAGLATLAIGERDERRGEAGALLQDMAKPQAADQPGGGAMARLGDSLGYVFGKLWDDIKLWLALAVIVSGVVFAAMGGQPAEVLVKWGQGPLAMLLMLAVGVPLYVCATASTPIAAALLVAGVSPGVVLVLLLAGPATNLGSIAILRKELGTRTIIAYLGAISVCSIGAGLIVDALVSAWNISITSQVEHTRHLFPKWVGIAAALWLIAMAIPPVRRLIFPARPAEKSCCSTTPTPAPATSCCSSQKVSAAPVAATSCCCAPSITDAQRQAIANRINSAS